MALRISNTITVPSDAVSSGASASVSANMGGFADWEDCPVLDIARMARGFVYGGQSVDAQGNLSGLSGSGLSRTFFVSAAGDNGDTAHAYRNGDYTLFWDGGAGVGVSGAIGLTVNSVGSGTASLTLDFSAPQSFKFTGISDADPPTNIRIVKDTDLAAYNAGQMFRDELLDLIGGKLHCLRFMDWMKTNGSSIVDYADYPQESWQRWNTGVPMSVIAKLCNAVGADPWICIPHQATDACVTSMLTDLHNNLDSNRKVRVEYTNEAWNWIFDQFDWLNGMGLSEWGVSGAGLSWYGKRFVEIMDLAEAISPTRFQGFIGGQAGNTPVGRAALDAPAWKTNDAATYQAPHTRATFYGVADYYASPGGADAGFMETFDANWDSDRDAIPPVFWAWMESQLAAPRSYIDANLALCTDTDSVDGLTRNLRCIHYEGGSNHTDPVGAETSRWFLPLAWTEGVEVMAGEYRKNQYGRVYKATAAGTTGATEPTHTDGSNVSDGSVVWTDFTGSDPGWRLRFDNSNSTPLAPETTILNWTSSTAYTTGDYVENSNGSIYEVTSGGAGGATEPTHTTGAQTIDGVEYTFKDLFLDNIRPEYAQWCQTYMYDAEEAQRIISLWNYFKDQGGESPMIFSLYGRLSKTGFWGKFLTFNDTGASRSREIGDILMAWSTGHPVWWGE